MILHWLLLAFIGHQHLTLGDDAFVCPSDTGAFPHPDSDTQFYICEDGIPVLKECTTGMFDADIGDCSEDQAADNDTTAGPEADNDDDDDDAVTTTDDSDNDDDDEAEADDNSDATAQPDANSATDKSSTKENTSESETAEEEKGESGTKSTATKNSEADDSDNENNPRSQDETQTPTTDDDTDSQNQNPQDETETPAANDSTDSETQKPQDEVQPLKAETFRADTEYDYSWDYAEDYRTYGEEHLGADGEHVQQNDGHGDHGGIGVGEEVEESFLCPNESGFYRHPSNCSRFYWCIQWTPTPMYCAEGTAFDPKTNVCSWIVGSDGCGGQLAAPTYQDKRRPFDRFRRTVKNVRNLRDVKVFHDVRNSRHRRQADDYDYYYDSDDGHHHHHGHDYNNDDRQEGPGPREGRTYGLDSSDVDFGAGTTSFQCPGDGFYADPHDCSIFYHCANGKPYQHQCQPGTAFNKDKLVCSWPLESDGCGGMLSVPYKASVDSDNDQDHNNHNHTSDHNHEEHGEVEHEEEHEDNGKDGEQDGDRDGQEESEDIPDAQMGPAADDSGFQCPDDMEGYYPDPSDCKHFFHCVKGKYFRYKCANGTAFNGESGVCTWPVSFKTGCGVVLYRAEVDSDRPVRHPRQASGTSHRNPAGHLARTKRRSLPSWASGLFKLTDSPESSQQQEAAPKEAEKKEDNKKASDSSGSKKTDATEAKKSGDSSNDSKTPDDSKKSTSTSGAKTSTASTTTAPTTTTTTSATSTTATPTTTPTTTTTTTASAAESKVDKLEPLPGVIDSIQRTSAWPWESVERKRKEKSREDYITTKTPPKTTPTTSQPPTTGRKSATPTTGKPASTVKSSSTTTAQSTTTTTTKMTTTTAPQASTLAAKHPKAETYRVLNAETQFRCPSPTGHFRDPMNCAIYYHCVDDVAFRKECPDGELYDINFHRCLPINEVKDCRLVDEKKDDGWGSEWLSQFPEMNSYPEKVDTHHDFECDMLFGYFRDDQDCSAYVECIDGVPYHRKCMTGTVFDNTRKKCTWSSLVPDCHVTPGSEASAERDYQVDTFQCPTTDGYYRDPSSCSTYYHCIDGRAMRRVCDPNNFFDPQASQCRWARLVTDCDDRGLPVFVDKLPLSKFVCPLPNGHYRDPENCSVFYHCLQDVPYRGACRRHHAFDVDLLTCVPRRNVPGCEQNHVSEESQSWGKEQEWETEGARSGTVPQDLTTTLGTDSASVSFSGGSSDAEGFRCPKAHGLFRDPEDCRVFYHCFSGRHFRHECQFGTVFSLEKNLCTWPALVPDCQAATQAPEMASEAVKDSIEQSTKDWISSNLPADFKHDHQHDAPATALSRKPTTTPRVLTTKSDVTKGRSDVTQVPADDVTKAQPFLSKEVNSAAEQEPFDYDLAEVHTPKLSSDGLNNFIIEAALPDGMSSDPYNEFICPQLVFDQYFRDPLDCTRFHRCVKGLRFTFDCPRGTFFDPVYNICDFQEKVPDCDHEGRRLGTAKEPLASENEVSIPLYTGNGGEYMTESAYEYPLDPMCPKSDGLFAHPSSCNKFVYCARGSPVVLTCPADLLYNVDTMTCDYQDKIVCVRYDK